MDGGRYTIEIEPEVRLWLENIPAHHYKQAERVADLLAEQPTTLDEPHSRHLGGKLRELRFRLGDVHQRITYWLAPDRRVVLLTVFRRPRCASRPKWTARTPLNGCVKPSTRQPPSTTSTAATSRRTDESQRMEDPPPPPAGR